MGAREAEQLQWKEKWNRRKFLWNADPLTPPLRAVESYLSSVVVVQVDLLEVIQCDLTSTIFVTFIHEFLNILISWWERKEVLKHWLNVSNWNCIFTLLIEKVEAFLGLGILAWLLKSTVPMPVHNMLAEFKVHCVSISDLRIALLQFCLNVPWTHFVETKVLEDVFKEVVWDPSISFLIIMVKAFFEIVEDLDW